MPRRPRIASGCLIYHWRRLSGGPDARALLPRWPLPELSQWRRLVYRPQSEADVKSVRHSVRRSTPFGSSQWQVRTARRLGLEWTLRARGRPRVRKAV